MNSIRVEYIKNQILSSSKKGLPSVDYPLSGLTALHVGCGGGLLSESLAHLGASQTCTAQIFAQQLAKRLEEEHPDVPISIEGRHKSQSPGQLPAPGQGVHVFLTSVTGAGNPPDNGRAFYEYIMKKNSPNIALQDLEYAIFGLSNQRRPISESLQYDWQSLGSTIGGLGSLSGDGLGIGQ
jgi:sulfite reductase alpha subunit-like flavoprotein